jgi:CheY-like chemotaxis protein
MLHSPIRILVADDDFFSLELLGILLELENYSIQKVSGACQALESLSKEPFDLVISDLNMPEMNGFELIAQIRILYPGLPVIILSANEEEVELKENPQAQRPEGWVLKNESMREDLLAHIRRVLS